MSVWDTINRIFRPEAAPPTTSDEPEAIPPLERQSRSGGIDYTKMFGATDSRRERVDLSRKMYDQDPRAKRIIQTMAGDMTANPYILEVDNQKALDVAEALRQRLKLDQRLDDWARLTLRDGDSLLELSITADRQIYTVTRKPTLQMNRNSDDRDMFPDPIHAFWLTKKPWQAVADRDAIWFAEWQIIHARWDHDEGDKYGTPLLAASRTAWKKLVKGEMDVAIRRNTRSGKRYVHMLKDAGPAQIEEYKIANRDVLDDHNAAIQDFFISNGDIKAIEGDTQLGDITDIRHHLNTFWIGAYVPMAVLGYGQDVDFSVVGHQKQQYDEHVITGRNWLASQIIIPLLERQWLLAGIAPEQLDYKIVWPSKQQITAADLKFATEAALHLQALGAPPSVIAHALAPYLPGITPEMLLADEGSEVATERMANILKTLTQSFAG